MNAPKPTPYNLLVLALAALFVLAACAPQTPSKASSPERPGESYPVEPAEIAEPLPDSSSAPADVLASAAGLPSSPRDGMVAFEGSVFVATTELVTALWQAAGWSIAEEPVSVDPADLPVDCTLHPHAGVANQWFGRCRGYILIPQSGARDIAVMVTDEAGATTMVQVAPPPGELQP